MQVEDRGQIRAISGIFTTATVRALAAPEPWRALERFEGIESLMAADSSLGVALDQAYDTLMKVRRSQYMFKNTLVSKTVYGRHRPSTAAASIEFPVGRSFADVVVFNGSITAYEVHRPGRSEEAARSRIRV